MQKYKIICIEQQNSPKRVWKQLDKVRQSKFNVTSTNNTTEHKAAQEIFSEVESCVIIHVWIMVRF